MIVFFVTSADSGAMVLNMLSSDGRDDTPMLRRVFWMAMIALSAMVLSLAGGLSALQTAAIASALPFSMAILAAIWGFVRALSVDHAKRQTLLLTTVAPTGGAHSTDWKERLDNLLLYPTENAVKIFINHEARLALEMFAQELCQRGLDARVEVSADGQQVALAVLHGDETHFQYQVHCGAYALPDDALVTAGASHNRRYYRAEVHLTEAGQG